MCTTCQQIENLTKRLSKLEADQEQANQKLKGEKIQEVYSPKEVAKMLHFSYDHIRDLCFSGRLESFRDGRRGRYMIKHSAILKFTNKNQQNA